jgi:hypothetical protein
MMHPDRIPTISVGIIVPTDAEYDCSHHWPNSRGVWHASVRFDAGGYSTAHIQGEPAALRELAAALHLAADQADTAEQADATRPTAQAVGS